MANVLMPCNFRIPMKVSMLMVNIEVKHRGRLVSQNTAVFRLFRCDIRCGLWRCLIDLDLTEAVRKHKKNGGIATIITKNVMLDDVQKNTALL